MKAITIHQPWASLIAVGAKKIETRSWATNYRGPIAIHAGKGILMPGRKELPVIAEALFRELSPRMDDVRGDFESLPCGAVIAIADLVECWTIDGYGHDLQWQPGVNDSASKFYYVYPVSIKEPKAENFSRIKYPETLFGYYPDCGFKKEPRYAWELANIRPIDPIPARGRQRLWEWDGDRD